MLLAEFSIWPMDKGESVSPYVARCLDIIDRSPRPGDAARSGGAPSAPTEVTKP